MKISFKVIVLGALLAAGTSLYAQGASPHPSGSNHIDVSTLKGTVQGASGAVHPVTITATNLTNGQKHTVTATSGGGFVFNTVHNILSDVPAQNIVAMYEAVEEFNR